MKTAKQLFTLLIAIGWGFAPGAAADQRPDILLVVADDMGYTDWGGFGGEIRTPHLDALARRGQMFTQFYTAPTCSPTRAMLLTGVDHHRVGLGSMLELLRPNQIGQPGYEGHLNDRAATLPELLQGAGYRTMMAGKWHLGLGEQQDPSRRGFDHSFAMFLGAASHFGDEAPYTMNYPPVYRHDGQRVHLPDRFYSSDFYADRLIEWIGATPENQPLLAYLAFTAPHDPLHVPDEWLDRYRGRYDQGYDQLRSERIDRLVDLGLLKDADLAAPRPPHVPAWDQLSTEQQAISARSMEIYAAMVENLDANVGRVIEQLKQAGRYDNTLIIFISDNGANGIMLQANPLVPDGWVERNSDNRLENIGRKGSRPSTGPGWALAGTAPFALHKLFISEGGIRAPLIIAGPGVTPRSAPVTEIATVQDLMPTLLEFAGVTPPTHAGDRPLIAIEGKSMHPLLTGNSNRLHDADAEFGFELFGMQGLRRGDWKISSINKPFGTARWQLFNLAEDPGETTDLADQYPDKLEQLINSWQNYARRTGVVLPDKPIFGAGSEKMILR
ncbi:MAG: arylsulfatase [Gammaproteobacteria bacterium]